MKLNHFEIILYVKDQKLSRDFYSALLNAAPTLDVPGMTEFSLGDNLKLGLMPEEGISKILTPIMPHPASGSGIPRCELYLHANEIVQVFRRAINAGAKVISPVSDRDWGHKVGYLADPDGHIIALASEI